MDQVIQDALAYLQLLTDKLLLDLRTVSAEFFDLFRVLLFEYLLNSHVMPLVVHINSLTPLQYGEQLTAKLDLLTQVLDPLLGQLLLQPIIERVLFDAVLRLVIHRANSQKILF